MSVVVIQPPEPIVSLALARAHVRLGDFEESEDGLLEDYSEAAQASIDGPAGWLGRCIAPQTLELRTNCFAGADPLPYGPVLSIVSVKYVDPDGAEQTVPDTAYQVVEGGLALAPSASWPSLRGDGEGVRVRYRAGYEQTPAAVRQAILLLISTWFRNRSSVVTGTIAAVMPHGVETLLSPFRKLA